MPVQRPHRCEGLQNHQIECALKNISLVLHYVSPVGCIEESNTIPVGCKEEDYDASLPKRSRSPDLGSVIPLNAARTPIDILMGPTIFSVIKMRSEEHTSELQSRLHLVCRLLLEKKKIHRDWL